MRSLGDGVGKQGMDDAGPGAGTAQETQIVLRWLVRLRWLAAAGQTIATLVAYFILKLKLPLGAIESVILLTLASNVVIHFWTTRPARLRRVGWCRGF